MPRRRSRRSSRGSRRRTTWDQSRFTHIMTAAASQSTTDISPPNLDVGATQTATILRLIGQIQLISPLTAGAADVAVGVCVVSADAAQGAVPDPLTDQSQDWYYWRSGLVPLTTGLVAGGGSTNPVWEFDIRTSRRLRGGYRLVAISENDEDPEIAHLHWNVRGLWTIP